jgi:hypothetical protein
VQVIVERQPFVATVIHKPVTNIVLLTQRCAQAMTGGLIGKRAGHP